MFGYIKPRVSELRVREHECYRATYCGLCHSMAKTLGRASCGTLSYDFAFLGVIRMILTGESPEFEKRRCAAHPFRKRASVKNNQSLEYCSAAAALLSYGKCRDDINDEKGFRRLRARLALPFFARARKKALKRVPELTGLDRRIASLLSEMSEIERNGSDEPSADRLGELFGMILGEIVSFGLDGREARTSYAFGKAIGHWLYLVDAADDYAEDVRMGRFNPYAAIWSDEKGFDACRREDVSCALIALLMDAERALDLFPPSPSPELCEIAKNTIYLGMPAEAKKVLKTNEVLK